MVTVWVALIAAGSALGASVLTAWISQRSEGNRRGHELEMRSLDHAHDDRSHLLEERLNTYRSFLLAFVHYRRVHDDLSVKLGHRQHLTEQLSKTSGGDQNQWISQFDEWEPQFRVALDTAGTAQLQMEDALLAVELLASPPVYAAAEQMAKLAVGLWDARRSWASKPFSDKASPDEWGKVTAAVNDLDSAHAHLREAIRGELRLAGSADRKPPR